MPVERRLTQEVCEICAGLPGGRLGWDQKIRQEDRAVFAVPTFREVGTARTSNKRCEMGRMTLEELIEIHEEMIRRREGWIKDARGSHKSGWWSEPEEREQIEVWKSEISYSRKQIETLQARRR